MCNSVDRWTCWIAIICCTIERTCQSSPHFSGCVLALSRFLVSGASIQNYIGFHILDSVCKDAFGAMQPHLDTKKYIYMAGNYGECPWAVGTASSHMGDEENT